MPKRAKVTRKETRNISVQTDSETKTKQNCCPSYTTIAKFLGQAIAFIIVLTAGAAPTLLEHFELI